MAMKWTNLLKNKCPKCGRGTLQQEAPIYRVLPSRMPDEQHQEVSVPQAFACTGKKCDFGITEARFKEVVISITEKKIDRRYY